MGINFSMVASLFMNISSRTGLTSAARIAVVAPTKSMHNAAMINFGICGFANMRRRLNISIHRSLFWQRAQGSRIIIDVILLPLTICH